MVLDVRAPLAAVEWSMITGMFIGLVLLFAMIVVLVIHELRAGEG